MLLKFIYEADSVLKSRIILDYNLKDVRILREEWTTSKKSGVTLSKSFGKRWSEIFFNDITIWTT